MAKKSVSHATKRVLFLLTGIIVLGFIFGLFLTKNQQEQPCANSISCIDNLSGEYEAEREGTFLGKNVVAPAEKPLLAKSENNTVLGVADNKRIFVNLTTQHIEAKEGDRVVYSFPISSGKWGWTPTGDFRIWIKLKYTRMQGGSQARGTYYNLPNVPYTMYFYNEQIPKWRGYALHGAYWHNNFGHPMSHGCINISPENAKLLYEWATPVSGDRHTTYASAENPGTLITIFGKAPWE